MMIVKHFSIYFSLLTQITNWCTHVSVVTLLSVSYWHRSLSIGLLITQLSTAEQEIITVYVAEPYPYRNICWKLNSPDQRMRYFIVIWMINCGENFGIVLRVMTRNMCSRWRATVINEQLQCGYHSHGTFTGCEISSFFFVLFFCASLHMTRRVMVNMSCWDVVHQDVC